MNILLEFSTINYKIWHSLAKRLKELYPEARFAGILGFAPGGDQAWEFLKNQTDIKYEFIYIKHEIVKKAFESDILFSELKKFEEGLLSKSLWRLIAADRGLGSSFLHGSLWKRTFINQNNTHENILRIFSGMLSQLREVFFEFKVDLFFPAVARGGISIFIYEELCKEFNIPYLVPSNVRIKNFFAFSADSQLRFPQIDDTYRRLLSKELKLDLSRAQALYEDLIAELGNPQYFDRINSRFNIINFNSPTGKMKWVTLLLKAIIKQILHWQETKALRKSQDIRRQPNDLRTLLNNLSYTLQFIHQKLRVTSPNFASEFNSKEKYIYYPLHINPEYSTQVQGTMWLDQIYLIELLAKSIPFDWKVYVKEHPGTLVARVRPPSFYKKIRCFPNVKLIPIDTDMHTVISNAQMVAVITGTSGWEAVLRGKPVITFADNMWDVLGLSRKCCDVERLSFDIYEITRRVNAMSCEERRRRIIYFLASVLEHSFEVTYPNQFVFTDSGTDQEYAVVGRETADALMKHLNYLEARRCQKV